MHKNVKKQTKKKQHMDRVYFQGIKFISFLLSSISNSNYLFKKIESENKVSLVFILYVCLYMLCVCPSVIALDDTP